MAATTDRNRLTGVYQSSCCSATIGISEGERFPICIDCQQFAIWRLIKGNLSAKAGKEYMEAS